MAMVVALITCFVVIPLGAYAVDLGVQRVARSDAQSVADTVALDMARQLGSHNADSANHAAPPGNGTVLTSVPQAASMTGATPTVRIWQGHLTESAFAANRQSFGCGWQQGDPAPSNGYFSPTAGASGTFTAVLVTVTGSVRFNLAGGSGGVCRSAVASADSLTCFTVGSYVANLSNDTGLLSIIDPPLGAELTAVGYQGLASEDISITSLDKALKVAQASAGIGSPQGLAATNITLGQLLGAEADVLRAGGNTAQADIIDNYVGTLASAAADANISAQVASLVSAATGNGAAASAGINALDLLGTAAMIANGEHFLSDYIASKALGFTADVTLIDGAHEACGVAGAQATSDQVSVDASEALAGTAVSGLINALAGSVAPGLTFDPPSVAFTLDTGQATGTLGNVTCSPDTIPISVSTTLAGASVATQLSVHGNDVAIGDLSHLLNGLLSGLTGVISGLLGVSVTADVDITATVGASTSQGGGTTPLTWAMGSGTPPDTYQTVKRTGANHATLPHASVTTPLKVSVSDVQVHLPLGVSLKSGGLDTLTNNIVSSLTSALTGTLDPVVSSLNSTIDTLNPLLQTLQQSLGLSFPGADVTVKPTAKCAQPYLG
jgi:uncharacterized membrane protein